VVEAGGGQTANGFDHRVHLGKPTEVSD